MRTWLLLALILTPAAATAQESSSFNLDESTLNLGGNPNGAAKPVSASFSIGLDALGGNVGSRPLAGGGSWAEGHRRSSSAAIPPATT